jgi:hypothetical protein
MSIPILRKNLSFAVLGEEYLHTITEIQNIIFVFQAMTGQRPAMTKRSLA